jgi:spectinomycin phosphotransferase
VSVRTSPTDLGDDEIMAVAAHAWGARGRSVDYVALGGGSHHWKLSPPTGPSLFVTVDDLDDKDWLGETREAAFTGLQRTLATAAGLTKVANLDFVVAPKPGLDGQVVQLLGSHYAMSVYPFLDGQSFPFGPHTDPDRRAELIGMVARLHASTETLALRPPDQDLRFGAREDLERVLDEPDRPWHTGPLSEPTRSLIVPKVVKLRSVVAGFDRMVATTPRPVRVVTHGEPHAANTIRVGGRLLLIDWDTVGMADPERDLWLVVPDDADIARYTEATGNAVDSDLMMLYRLRFLLDDIARTVRLFRRPHEQTADTRHWWEGLKHLLDALDSFRDVDS